MVAQGSDQHKINKVTLLELAEVVLELFKGLVQGNINCRKSMHCKVRDAGDMGFAMEILIQGSRKDMDSQS